MPLARARTIIVTEHAYAGARACKIRHEMLLISDAARAYGEPPLLA